MTEPTRKAPHFVTISMGEILLAQNMLSETRKVVAHLLEREPDNPRVQALSKRLHEVETGEMSKQMQIPREGIDRVLLAAKENAVNIVFEVTEKGMAIAKKTARYSGRAVVRIFTAAPGPRGVRTVSRDIDVEAGAGAIPIFGMQRPAVHVASVGYLANTGTFVSLAQTARPLVIS